MFIDEVEIKIIAGDGGDGCSAFRREKYVPLGGPDGGNGGKGSNIIFKVDLGLKTLIDLKFQRTIKGEKGKNGSGKGQDGKNAKDIIIKVPEGTVVKDIESNLIVADLLKDGEELVVAYGGRGGRGNKFFKTNLNKAPTFSEKGEPGEFKHLKIELKMFADVGIIGMPSVGKSTILSKISNAKPKIAEYHFTTLSPNLGVVTMNNKTFVVADLPGLIEGASNNVGLGFQFLKHAERTKILAHVLDLSDDNCYENYLIINNELKLYDEKLIKKPQIIIANKLDLDINNNLKKLRKKIKEPIYEISALNNQNLDKVLIQLSEMITNIKEESLYKDEELESYILYKFKEEKPFIITKENNVFIVTGKEIERLFKMTKFNDEESLLRFTKRLRKMGIDDKLKEAGIQDNDTVRIIDYEFTYLE